jgi:tellurite resistance protein TerC
MDHTVLIWSGFTLFIVAMLALDAGVFHRKAHVVGMREAVTWTAVWIGLALAFNVGVWYFRGPDTALEFLTGYLVEKALSIDNVFVFVLIFSYFETPPAYQHKVLFWGIVGAILARTVFILGGLALLALFHWTMYVFGAFLLATGISMMVKKRDGYQPDRNPVLNIARRWLHITDRYEEGQFAVKHDGRWSVTPLLIVLLAVESTDIIFAVDSIPAVFAVTRDPFIVYSSNIFAVLGLRALYSAVAGFLRSFHYLHYGFASIIIILGIKMLVSDLYEVPIVASIGLIVVILTVAVVASVLRPRREDLKEALDHTEHRSGRVVPSSAAMK